MTRLAQHVVALLFVATVLPQITGYVDKEVDDKKSRIKRQGFFGVPNFFPQFFPQPNVRPHTHTGAHAGGQQRHHCRGHNAARRPECQQTQPVIGGGGATAPVAGGTTPTALNQISWVRELASGDGTISLPGLPKTPKRVSQAKRFQLGVNQPNVPHQACTTPYGEQGHCRHLQHCVLPQFSNNFFLFLRYVCFINGDYVGACCPDYLFPVAPTTAPTTPLLTTPRPTTPPSDKGNCGLNTKQRTRIVGGRLADPQEWPWMAALLRQGGTQYCGGVLISNRHILTAAHCVESFNPSTITVRLGEYTFGQTPTSVYRDFPVATIKMHEQYNTDTYVNDLALITIQGTTEFNDDIWPICLPSPGPDYVGSIATVTGWGTISFGGPVSSTLQEVTIPVWTNTDCGDAYKSQGIIETQLCAGERSGGKDSCQGDSGGPLQLQIAPENRWAAIGIVSWGIKCAEPNHPGVYTRVNRYLDWINSNAV